MAWFRRRRDEEDPLAALRGDGSITPVVAADPEPAPTTAAGEAPGRITARRDTGVLVGGCPRVRLTVEVMPADGPPFSLETAVVVGQGSAADVGDLVDVRFDGDEVTEIRLRPAIRPA